jgi:hypothetical protein
MQSRTMNWIRNSPSGTAICGRSTSSAAAHTAQQARSDSTSSTAPIRVSWCSSRADNPSRMSPSQ